MAKARGLAALRLEDLDLGAGIGGVVLTADNVGDLGVDIIADRRQGVEIAAILTDQDRVGQGRGLDGHVTAHQIRPADRIAGQFETPVRLAAFPFQRGLFRIGQLQRGAVIDRRTAIGHLQATLAVQLFTGLVTGIEQALGLEVLGRGVVAIKPLGLLEGLVPRHAQPGQVGADTVLIFLRGTLQVRIIDTQYEYAPGLAREQIVEQRGADIADMKLAGRAGSKTDFGHGIRPVKTRGRGLLRKRPKGKRRG